jgi:hypothetical protein
MSFQRAAVFAILVPSAIAGVAAELTVAPAAQGPTTGAAGTGVPGAVGDGKADDTAAIRRAIAAGGAVRLGRGVYRITAPLVIDLDKLGVTSLSGDGVATLVMAGPGPAIHLVGTHSRSAAPEDFEERVWQNQRMPLVDGLEVVGAHERAEGLRAEGTMQTTITRCRFQRLLHAVHLAGNNRNVAISDCHIYENRGIGVFYDAVNLHQSNIVGCHISYNRGGGIVTRGGNVRNIHIGTCDIEANHDPKGPPTANVLIDCTGGSTGEVAITGCTIQHTATAPGSANVRILGRGDERLGGEPRKTQEGHVTIVGNILSDVKVNVELIQCRGVTLTGNTFWMGFEHNLVALDCREVVVGPNTMIRNPRYAHSKAETSTGSVVFRRCHDCTVQGLHSSGARHDPAAITLEACSRFNVSGCTILDSDNIGLLLDDVRDSRVSDCLIRDDRQGATSTPLEVRRGGGNQLADNLVGGK